jgi:restriction system protein
MINRFSSFLARPRERHSYGEPEWMPGPEQVARTRAQMERLGIVPNLSRELIGAQVVPPGETPWLWWGAAVAWILAWPVVIAIKYSAGQPRWLPWWLPLLLALLHMALLAAPVLFDQRANSKDDLRRRFGRVRTLAQVLALEPDEFEAWSAMLFELMGYRVEATPDVADHGIDLQVSNEHVRRGLVQCKRYRGTVGESIVRDLYGTMMHENADYGWLLTTGGVSRQAREWSGGKPIELWDGQMLVSMARRCRR